ncbi:MAG: LytTR family transcriptional regulator DNA-binding domain-containing protein, partial [Bacteroidia bacterium]|nr:LytTR family transcriptional regulator DNA-binding domain-containing protein [Bacteroidia bacterium]
VLSTPMKTLEAHLGTESFVRSHRSFVVNVTAIESYDEFYLYLGDQPIPLGKSFKEEVMRRLRRV